MDKQFAEAKLASMEAAYRKALEARGISQEKINEMLAPDPVLQADIKKKEEFELTKDHYGSYLGLVQKDGVIAIILWKSGANPVGVLTALFINMNIPLP